MAVTKCIGPVLHVNAYKFHSMTHAPQSSFIMKYNVTNFACDVRITLAENIYYCQFYHSYYYDCMKDFMNAIILSPFETEVLH